MLTPSTNLVWFEFFSDRYFDVYLLVAQLFWVFLHLDVDLKAEVLK